MVGQKKKRSLEDLFREKGSISSEDFQSERGEYVTDPRRAERVEAIKAQEDKLNDQAAANTKVTTKADGTPQYQGGALNVAGIVAKEPATEPPVEEAPPRKLIPKDLIPKDDAMPPPAEDVLPEAKREAASEAPKKEDSKFPWDRALVGATPLLVGLLTGNAMEGAQVAGNHLASDEGDLYKRERDLEARLAEMQAKRDVAASDPTGTRRYRPQNIATPDGRTIKATFDSFTGQYLSPDGTPISSEEIRAGYAVTPEEFDRRKLVSSEVKRSDADYLGTNTKINPTDGQLGVIRNGRITPIKGQHTGDFTVKGEKDIEKSISEIKSSPIYKMASPMLEMASRVTALLDAAARDNDPNAIAGSGAVFQIARMMQGPGVLTDRDVERLGGNQQVDQIINRVLDKFSTGKPVTHRDVADLREVVSVAEQSAKARLGKFYESKVSTLSKRYGISPELMREQLDSDLGNLLAPTPPIKGSNAPPSIMFKGQRKTAPNRTQNMPVNVDGRLQWIDPAHWDIARDQFGATRIEE